MWLFCVQPLKLTFIKLKESYYVTIQQYYFPYLHPVTI